MESVDQVRPERPSPGPDGPATPRSERRCSPFAALSPEHLDLESGEIAEARDQVPPVTAHPAAMHPVIDQHTSHSVSLAVSPGP